MARNNSIDVILFYLKVYIKRWTFYKSSFISDISYIFSDVLLFALLSAVVGEEISRFLPLYGGNYIGYVIVGLLLHKLLALVEWAPYSALLDSFYTRRLEALTISPVGVSTVIVGTSIGDIVLLMVRFGIYIALGIVLGVKASLSLETIPWAALLTLLGVLACAGIGLVAASCFFLLQAKQDNPVNWLVDTAVSVASGVYFPVSILPPKLQLVSSALPHTYVYDGIRRLLLDGGLDPSLPVHYALQGFNPILLDAAMLTAMSAILISLGWRLFNYGFEKAKIDGRLSWWT